MRGGGEGGKPDEEVEEREQEGRGSKGGEREPEGVKRHTTVAWCGGREGSGQRWGVDKGDTGSWRQDKTGGHGAGGPRCSNYPPTAKRQCGGDNGQGAHSEGQCGAVQGGLITGVNNKEATTPASNPPLATGQGPRPSHRPPPLREGGASGPTDGTGPNSARRQPPLPWRST